MEIEGVSIEHIITIFPSSIRSYTDKNQKYAIMEFKKGNTTIKVILTQDSLSDFLNSLKPVVQNLTAQPEHVEYGR